MEQLATYNIDTLPTFDELVAETPTSRKENALIVLLNQSPPKDWIQKNNGVPYLPIEKVKFLLSRIYGSFQIEIKFPPYILANSVVCCVRLHVVNPITHKEEWQDGVGAVPIQLEKDSAATDWSRIKTFAIQMNTPSALSYAVSNAAGQFGKIFGRGLADGSDYLKLLKKITKEELSALYMSKMMQMNEEDKRDAKRILDENEIKSFQKLKTKLEKI